MAGVTPDGLHPAPFSMFMATLFIIVLSKVQQLDRQAMYSALEQPKKECEW